MTHDLKPYPAMKDSGVPWLGEVPEHWAVERLKSSVSNVIEQTAERQDADMYVALEHVESWTGRLRHAGSDVTFDSQVKRFRSGDVLFGKLRPYLAKVTRPRSGGVCVGEFFVLRPRNRSLATPYVEQVLRSRPIIEAINSSTFGAKMPRADWQFVGGMSVPRPPVPEQAAIVRFLDYADRRIRRFIRAKQNLIKLLEEQKQAIIHRAVTRGLNPNVRLKPSGVEWLGDVPEHWGIVRVKQCARVISKGTTPSTEGREILQFGPVRFLKAENISGGRVVDAPQCFIDEEAHKALRRSQLATGDVLFVIAGATLGKIAVVEQSLLPANTNQAVAFVRPSTRAVSEYLALWLQSPRVKEQVWIKAVQSAQPNLSMADLGDFMFLLPPTSEQRQTLLCMESRLLSTHTAIDRAKWGISLLREYRTRLIADVVTGKVDVREAAAGLPDEPTDEAADATPDIDDALEVGESEDDETGLEGEEVPV